MTRRLFVSHPIVGDTVQLAGAEAHHLLHVLRAELDSEWIVFDGSGYEYRARLVRAGKQSAELQVIQRLDCDRESGCQLRLATAFPKGDRQKWLVEKCTELGVHTLVPITSARSVVKPTTATISRLQRTVIETCKQCGRNRLMLIGSPVEFTRLVVEDCSVDRRIAAIQGTRAESLRHPTSDVLTVLIGPEGGFTRDEQQLALDHGWQTVGLGRQTLRIETAAIAIAAIVNAMSTGEDVA